MPITKIAILLFLGGLTLGSLAQETLTPNGIEDQRLNAVALTGAHLYLPDGQYREGATLLLRDGRIEAITGGNVPPGYFAIDLTGRYVYPGLIDMYSQYGLPEVKAPQRGGGAEVLEPENQALSANDAIRSYYRAALEFSPDEKQRETLRKLGFSTVLSLQADGIARGTSTLVTLGNESAQEAVVLADAAAHFSLSKGSSRQSYPSSIMGAVALLRQTYLDADWFSRQTPRPFADESLEGLLRSRELPQIMEADNWSLALTLDRVGDEFGTQYILKVGTDSYERSALLKATDAPLIVSVDNPKAPEVDDALDADDVSFAELKHWELAPYNLRLLNDAGIRFAVTSAGAEKDFWKNMRDAVARGLPESVAVDSLTRVPAQLLGVESRLGRLVPGALANLVVSSGPLFNQDARLLENWVRGERFVLDSSFDNRRGRYQFDLGADNYTLELDFADGKPQAKLLVGDTSGDSGKVNMELTEDLISLNFTVPGGTGRLRLNGWPVDNGWQGTGLDQDSNPIGWQLTRLGDLDATEVDADGDDPGILPAPVIYPYTAFGRESLPQRQDLVIRNATVWTNEDAGTLVADVLVRDGKIAAIGPNLRAGNATEVDGTGKHLTPGIIDEHSHIALFDINEGATNSSMVRMRDVLDSEDVSIYRDLAGGVTAAQLLHGSANPIGGQSAIIKMRWGLGPEQLLIEDAPPFIKFALGENVKRSTSPASVRYPQTRMGVEQVFVNAFSQAQEYGKRWDTYNGLSASARRNAIAPRRDLVNETMLEVINMDRYVTSHSYVQSEINMLMHVAEDFGFHINTFTHILEGYKVADKMLQHGAGGSTFADWWGYKWEVRYAIPYNAALMVQAGLVVAINSDDAEMSRRLNQEAAKTIKYGDLSEVDALKLVTLNPAKLLHLDHRMGSIRVGKDADLVLWTDHPLSIYAIADTTWVDGIPYYSRESDLALRRYVADERARIINKITSQGSAPESAADKGEAL